MLFGTLNTHRGTQTCTLTSQRFEMETMTEMHYSETQTDRVWQILFPFPTFSGVSRWYFSLTFLGILHENLTFLLTFPVFNSSIMYKYEQTHEQM